MNLSGKFSPALLWLLASQAVGLATGLIFAAVAARKLTPVEFAWLGTWQVMLAYGAVLAEFGTSHVAVRRIAGGGEETSTVAAVWQLRAGGGLVGAVLASAAFFIVWPEGVPLVWVALLAVAVLATAAIGEWWHLARGGERRVALTRLARQAVLLTGAALLLRTPLGWIAPLVYVAATLVQAVTTWPRPEASAPRAGRVSTVSVWRECWPLGLALLAQQWVWNGALLRAARELPAETFGGLVVGYRCYLVGIALLTAYAAYLLPRSAAALRDASPAALTARLRELRRHAWALTALFGVGAPVAAWLVPFIFGDRYGQAPTSALWYVASLIVVVWRIVGSNTLVALGQTRAYLGAAVLGSVVALAAISVLPAEWWFAPVLVLVAGEGVFALASLVLLRRSFR